MTLWVCCPNPKCDAPPIDQDPAGSALPGSKCYWCGTTIEAMPDEAYENPPN